MLCRHASVRHRHGPLFLLSVPFEEASNVNRSLAVLALLCMTSATLAGCVTTRPRAQVAIDIVAESGVRTDAQTLYVSVRGGNATGPLATRFEQTLTAPFEFPISLTVVPADDDTSRVYEVLVVAAARGGRVIGRQTLRGRFLAGTTSYVQLLLEDCCRSVAETCAPNETCRLCGCVETTVVDPEADAGMSPPDAALDAPGLDAGVPDAWVGCRTATDCPVRACASVICGASHTCEYTSRCAEGEECCNGVCAANCDCQEASRGHVCRAASDECDAPEVCGEGPACPPDALRASGTMCRVSSGECDPEERCTGSSAACPENLFVSAGTRCNEGTGACDGAGVCSNCIAGAPCTLPSSTCSTGVWVCEGGSVCTPNGPAPAGTVCRAATTTCDVAETCNGSTMACPADTFAPATTVCRASAGACDAIDHCTGTSAACPDTVLPATTVCRGADECDPEERCDGSSAACPPDRLTAAGTSCGVITENTCQGPSVCTGTSAGCPPVPNGTRCRCNGRCEEGSCIENCSYGICCAVSGECELAGGGGSCWSSY